MIGPVEHPVTFAVTATASPGAGRRGAVRTATVTPLACAEAAPTWMGATVRSAVAVAISRPR